MEYIWENLIQLLSTLILGGTIGSLVTFNCVKKHYKADKNGNISDQTNACAQGDIVGRDKKI